jgi:hypothetical protein
MLTGIVAETGALPRLMQLWRRPPIAAVEQTADRGRGKPRWRWQISSELGPMRYLATVIGATDEVALATRSGCGSYCCSRLRGSALLLPRGCVRRNKQNKAAASLSAKLKIR